MNSKAESVIRKIIREELEYYFERLEKRLVESAGSSKKIETQIRETTTPDSGLRKNLRKKYSGILGSISENIDVSDPFDETSMDMGVTADRLPDTPAMSSVKDALSRDYSALLKKINAK